MAGWLAAGVKEPKGDFVMVGLGSGAGAVGLLLNFPECYLTVVEYSPEVRELAEDAFPVLRFLQDQGRLVIVIEDAGEFFRTPQERWDVGLADAYVGENDHLTHYLDDFVKATDHQWFNVIGQPRTGVLPAMIKRYPIRAAYTEYGHQGVLANWLLTSVADDLAYREFVPFPRLDHPSAVQARTHYHRLLGHNALADLKRTAQ